jgi:hypothetical protein
MNYNYIKKSAEEYFVKGDYNNALVNYGIILKDNPEDKEAKICALLCDLAEENEFEAHAIFDYYFIAKKDNDKEVEERVEKLIVTAGDNMNQISELLSSLSGDSSDYLDGISYEEFDKIVNEDGDFRKSFENIVYSTKVIITNKYEMYQFLNTLIKNRFYSTAVSYIESANAVFKNDKKLVDLIDKIRKLREIEAKIKS